MWLLQRTSSAARTALVYITIGALIVIWTGVWWLYLRNNPPETTGVYYWCGGFMVTGLTLIAIGLGIGQIGRSARHADLPPPEQTSPTTSPPRADVAVMPTAVPAAPVAPVAGVIVPEGQKVVRAPHGDPVPKVSVQP